LKRILLAALIMPVLPGFSALKEVVMMPEPSFPLLLVTDLAGAAILARWLWRRSR